ncbi:divalent-cation tolerance protein CutA [Mesoterricola sediminis]|uniref:Divalent-cation tolerance protein CutA n=1 Tax=Mesoterricola sediminis TaxID=2927980 RepID=A0AA48HDZ8_9BACT|nr:divalent-cation tolerance protein CutA [Mesoterricola sediminis]BDU76518.1 divalent-cation tolerance protein CutA [Mesoterricola sediminis]
MINAVTIFTTCGSEETALTIAAAVVDQGYAACVNILPGIKSYYYYKGGTHLDEEVLLMIKTSRDRFEEVSRVISELHTYEIPEILMVPVEKCSESFLEWIEESVSRES